MENLRKRTEREVTDARLYGIASFAREVLQVADNMHRALEAIGPELREHADGKVKALIEGVELTERELMKALEKSGVKKFSPMAEKFDPNLQQAMFEMETAEVPPGHVAQVMQAGYMIGERVLRPAMVGRRQGAVGAERRQRQSRQRLSVRADSFFRGINSPLVPAKAGTQCSIVCVLNHVLDSRLRGNERSKVEMQFGIRCRSACAYLSRRCCAPRFAFVQA